jgi:hypothetical protein
MSLSLYKWNLDYSERLQPSTLLGGCIAKLTIVMSMPLGLQRGCGGRR